VNQASSRPRWLLPVAATLVLALATLAYLRAVTRRAADRLDRTSITQELIAERVQNVAKLVSTEQTVRDVVLYQNTWYGSTKRSLVVVTGKLLAGIDLQQGSDVIIDSAARRITITIPPAELLAIDISGITTYDEKQGWWNPFRPADRDAIYRQVRVKLAQASRESRLVEKANESAKTMLETMFSVDGWTAEVVFRPLLIPGASAPQ
jgi:uncharacterized protein DUF4230